jgi:hypothetical protein
VPEAIGKCYGAGIDVVMMTGDNLNTGSEIARQAGFRDIWAIEAKDFMEAIKQPRMGREFPNVIARCTPTNKLDILKWAQARGYVCSMTGDGVNDSPSLNYADVGIAMGSGTSVAKEAADIVLLNDAFPSIVTGVKWGRSLYKNIKNFLFFQLSINVSACLVALFGPVVGVGMPFTVTQFLWINLVMDSLAAIALASQPADEKVLGDKPRPREEFIINGSLSRAIFGFGGFVWILSTLILLGMEHLSALQSAMGDNIIVADHVGIPLGCQTVEKFNDILFAHLHGFSFRVSDGDQPGTCQGEDHQGHQHQLDDDAGDAADQRGSDPGEGGGAGGEDQRLGKAGDDAAQCHGGEHTDVEVGQQLAGADKFHHQAGNKTVNAAFHHHGGQHGGRGHSGDDGGQQGAHQAGEKTVGPAADKAAQQHGDVHGQKYGAGVGNGVESQRQNHAKGDAGGGKD